MILILHMVYTANTFIHVCMYAYKYYCEHVLACVCVVCGCEVIFVYVYSE